ncbi:MAG TPA: GNAT family N-acetyltransferase [Candidatus Merdenecus merdavium]|nr:GNAT family N-acetyltransferase [Candidatus Merdenecus merdavium]
MLTIREMKASDREEVLAMVRDFYTSAAVDHNVPMDILISTFMDAVGEEPSVWGMMLCEGETVVGYSYLTTCYACEVGGRIIILEELYMKDEYRGKGYGQQFFDWMFQTYSNVKRFRLEVTKANEGAIALYERLGFEPLAYNQMIKDI